MSTIGFARVAAFLAQYTQTPGLHSENIITITNDAGSSLSLRVDDIAHILATQARAAAEVPATAWIDVSAQMPPPGRPVLVAYTTHHTPPRQRVNRAMWIPAKFEEADGESDNFEYDEATDTNWTPAGWYECIDHWDEYSAVAMASVTVTQWTELPLPAAPAASKGDALDRLAQVDHELGLEDSEGDAA